jgi:D-3-phosphoglycerate dehydrogenase / 2-oxoglutarate reductase
MRGSILIVDDMHPGIVPGLQKLGFTADYRPDIQRAEMLDVIRDYVGIIIRSKTEVDGELLSKASNLKFVARAGAGTDKIDLGLCEQRKIPVLNAPEGNQDALAEHALGMLIALMNKIVISDQQVRQFIWDREGNRGHEIHGKFVGIIGYGHMGSAFAKRLAGFSCQVLSYDKYKTGYEDIYARESTMEQLFNESDILSLHVPLTEETLNYYNFDFFRKFKKELWLINTARGNILPLGDLIRLLESGKVRGAALDVLEKESLQKLNKSDLKIFEELVKYKNVVFTPHVAGWTHESYRKINETLLEKIGRLNMI